MGDYREYHIKNTNGITYGPLATTTIDFGDFLPSTVRLLTLEVPHTFSTIDYKYDITVLNNLLDFVEDDCSGTAHILQATITVGEYDFSDLLTEIGTQMTAISLSGGFGNEYTVTEQNNSVNISGTGEGFRLLFGSGAGIATSISTIIGFPAEDSAYLAPYTATFSIGELIIIGPINNIIDFVEDNLTGTTYILSAALDIGLYTITEVLNDISAKMTAISLSDGFNLTYTAEYVDSMYIKISSTGEFRLLWNSGVNSATSARDILGFPNLDSAFGLLYIGGEVVDPPIPFTDNILYLMISTNAADGWDNSQVIPTDQTKWDGQRIVGKISIDTINSSTYYVNNKKEQYLMCILARPTDTVYTFSLVPYNTLVPVNLQGAPWTFTLGIYGTHIV